MPTSTASKQYILGGKSRQGNMDWLTALVYKHSGFAHRKGHEVVCQKNGISVSSHANGSLGAF